MALLLAPTRMGILCYIPEPTPHTCSLGGRISVGKLHKLEVVPKDQVKKLSVEFMLDQVRAVCPVSQ